MPFYFEKTQKVRFVMVDTLRRDGDNEIGEIITTISALMGAKA
jgi:hypothetical protein